MRVPKVEIYTGALCGYCVAAKRLLRSKRVAFEEIKVSFRPRRRAEMIARANGRHTVPQIFIDGTHVGGSDDLRALDRAGELDRRLGLAATRSDG